MLQKVPKVNCPFIISLLCDSFCYRLTVIEKLLICQQMETESPNDLSLD